MPEQPRNVQKDQTSPSKMLLTWIKPHQHPYKGHLSHSIHLTMKLDTEPDSIDTPMKEITLHRRQFIMKINTEPNSTDTPTNYPAQNPVYSETRH